MTTSNYLRRLLLLFLVILVPAFSGAKEFKNSYLKFDLPERWNCVAEGTEYVCRSDTADSAKEAIIIFTAKEVGPSDSLEQYEIYLKSAKTIPGPTGPVHSQVRQVVRKQIADQMWIDGLHLSSEIPNYYTRYLATVKGRIAILITFSAHVSVYTKYSQDFINSIMSLRVVATEALFQSKSAGAGDGSGEVFGGPGGGMGGPDMMSEDGGGIPGENAGPASRKKQLFLFGIILAAIGIYLIIKMKK